MLNFRFPQRNCHNNCNHRPFSNYGHPNNRHPNCDQKCQDHDSCQDNNPNSVKAECTHPYYEPRCHPCYNEADYQVDAILELFEEYCQIESRADAHFNNALAKLCGAIEEIEKGLHCNSEGREVWGKMEIWLARYYERFGEYCGCIDKMHEFRVCVKKLLMLEWCSLEATKFAYAQLGESRNLDKELYILKSEIQDHCLPKC